MTDVLTPEQRHKCMSSVRSTDTKIELRVRKALHAAGFRFRLHRKDLPGCPDIVLPRFSTIVFVHGCFWHGHGCKKSKLPTTNVKFWEEKISDNKERDLKNLKYLAERDWQYSVLWECELEAGVFKLIDRLRKSEARLIKRL